MTDIECSICGYGGEMVDINHDKAGTIEFYRCPNCGTEVNKKTGWIYSAADDISDVGLLRMLGGMIAFIAGCWMGLGGEGTVIGITGLGLLAWGKSAKEKAKNKAKKIKAMYPYWHNTN